MNCVLYGNGGSENHGCEAIVRGTYRLLQESLIISSEAIEEDKKYGLDEICDIYNAKTGKVGKIQFAKAYVRLKLTGDHTAMDGLSYLNSIKQIRNKASLALSVGGDNYCYSNQTFYAFLNKMYRKNGIKTVLWGCSIEPDIVKRKKVSRDLNAYSLVVARESITYKALRSIGANVVLAPDPAFYMQPQKCDLDKRFEQENVVGINISPMIISNESYRGKAYENYRKLVEYILVNTDMQIALIPHVVWRQNDDREVLNKLYNDFNQDSRLILIEDHTAPELKYIISKCKLFVGARTHATIAAYSMTVPTLVVGYSVKARGIATDLFGTSENYVLPVQNLTTDDQLISSFQWLITYEDEIRNDLKKFIPKYIENGKNIKTILEKV